MNIKEIAAEAVLQAVDNGAQFIDVREPYEIDEVAYNIPNKMEIPLGEIQGRMEEIPKDRPIIVGCRSGARSLNACKFLAMQGYDQISNLTGGIMGWQANGFPTK